MTENANPKPFNMTRQKCQRRKLGRTALLGLSGLSVNQSTDPFTVKLAEHNSNQRLSKM